MRYCLPESKAVNQQLVKEQSREGRAVTDKVILRQLCTSREEGTSRELVSACGCVGERAAQNLQRHQVRGWDLAFVGKKMRRIRGEFARWAEPRFPASWLLGIMMRLLNFRMWKLVSYLGDWGLYTSIWEVAAPPWQGRWGGKRRQGDTCWSPCVREGLAQCCVGICYLSFHSVKQFSSGLFCSPSPLCWNPWPLYFWMAVPKRSSSLLGTLVRLGFWGPFCPTSCTGHGQQLPLPLDLPPSSGHHRANCCTSLCDSRLGHSQSRSVTLLCSTSSLSQEVIPAPRHVLVQRSPSCQGNRASGLFLLPPGPDFLQGSHKGSTLALTARRAALDTNGFVLKSLSWELGSDLLMVSDAAWSELPAVDGNSFTSGISFKAISNYCCFSSNRSPFNFLPFFKNHLSI